MTTMENGRANELLVELFKNMTDLLWTSCHMSSINFLKVKSLLFNGRLYKFTIYTRKAEGKYRGLSVTNSISRLYREIIKARIENQFEGKNRTHFVQANFE